MHRRGWGLAAVFMAVAPVLEAGDEAPTQEQLRRQIQTLKELVEGAGMAPATNILLAPRGPKGDPGDTLGRRVQDMLKGKAITQEQYDRFYDILASFPRERTRDIQGIFEHGLGEEALDALAKVWQRKATALSEETGVPVPVIDRLMGGPLDALGQRARDMIEAGTITQAQFDGIEGRIRALKNVYDQGAGERMAEELARIRQRKVAALSEEFGVPVPVIDQLASGPVDALEQRVQDMLEGGTISQVQCDRILARIQALKEILEKSRAGDSPGDAP